MLSKRVFLCKKHSCLQLICAAKYSRKSDSDKDYYKVVKSNDIVKDVSDGRLGSHPNWELFGPRGYRFLLPGSLGPAWHEVGSMIPYDIFSKSTSKLMSSFTVKLECAAQECPILLRKGVIELFPHSEANFSQQITVVTLTHKNPPAKRRKCSYVESEYYAKTFIWAAQEICMRLKDSGFWADFINPFSGKPYISPLHKPTLYETDERFRCLGFEIKNNNNCKVIQSRKNRKFIGNLFTNAPVNTPFLYDILNEN
ncbi:UNVERIFIED_CONTAM: hypothetical protein PYX00_008655 [Menopon gallinae]|uniref:Methylmalonic aciduria and homocystinuria type D homolog, mitochondrial n=1 Tax=Menopon gallinae TaxID=328185 RepID=A0AAW2HNZ8_9NEOP